MTSAQQIASGVIAVALVTTLVLPRRQTAAVIKAASSGFQGILKTAMGN